MQRHETGRRQLGLAEVSVEERDGVVTVRSGPAIRMRDARDEHAIDEQLDERAFAGPLGALDDSDRPRSRLRILDRPAADVIERGLPRWRHALGGQRGLRLENLRCQRR